MNWEPDTCGCKIEMADGVPVRSIVICDRHATSKVPHLDALQDNRMKNIVMADLALRFPHLDIGQEVGRGWRFQGAELVVDEPADAADAAELKASLGRLGVKVG